MRPPPSTDGFSHTNTMPEPGPSQLNGCARPVRNGCFGLLALLALSLIAAGALWIYLNPATTRSGPIVYGKRHGKALTLEVFDPEKAHNGAAVILVVSGGWRSNPSDIEPFVVAPLLRAGYIVFAVAHRSQPDATVGEIFQDVSRGVRWVRNHAGDYDFDPEKIGVTGGSAGGHLSLLLATRGDDGDPGSSDPVERESSKVQAVGIFFPVTDLLNLGGSTENDGTGGPPKSYTAAFGERAKDMAVWREEIGKELSPIYHVSPQMPPALIIHGDRDTLVPLEQSERFAEAARSAGGTVELIVKPGKGHGWLTMVLDLRTIANWFDRQLEL